jgi:hypothetical protein
MNHDPVTEPAPQIAHLLPVSPLDCPGDGRANLVPVSRDDREAVEKNPRGRAPKVPRRVRESFRPAALPGRDQSGRPAVPLRTP